ncbi:MAG: hypothetical protein H0T46_03085 [Deltaproteobacteria bacterium]|nr:hypothetical protein [Deltaproteobacteria bacterium]
MKVAMIARAWRTPLGNTVDAAMARLFAGERAATTDPRAGYPCSTIAPVRDQPAESRQARFLGRMGLFGLEVAGEALAASGIEAGPRTGVFCGVGGLRAHWEYMMPAFASQADDGQRMWERGLRDVHPYWMLRHLSNNVHALASATLRLRGDGATFGGGSASAQAIASASRALHDGAIDAALVIAYDSLLEPETLVELGARRSATHASLERLTAPYSQDAAGFVPGEAAAAIVLVRETDAPIAWIEVRDTAGAEPDSTSTLARCASHLADGATVVAGTGRAWPDLDAAERAAIGALVPRDAALVAPSAAMGQLGAATTLVQAIVLAESLRAGTLPPIAGLEHAAEGPLVPVTRATPTAARVALGVHASQPGLAAAIRVEVPR